MQFRTDDLSIHVVLLQKRLRKLGAVPFMVLCIYGISRIMKPGSHFQKHAILFADIELPGQQVRSFDHGNGMGQVVVGESLINMFAYLMPRKGDGVFYNSWCYFHCVLFSGLSSILHFRMFCFIAQ